MDTAYGFIMSFIRSMLTFSQYCYNFFLGGMTFARSTVASIINRFDAFMPGPHTLGLINSIFTSFGTVLFAILVVRLVMTIVNLINPLT